MNMDFPTIHITIDQKINLGNFESASVSMGISKLPFDADEEMINQALETQSLAYKMLGAKMREKIGKIRGESLPK